MNYSGTQEEQNWLPSLITLPRHFSRTIQDIARRVASTVDVAILTKIADLAKQMEDVLNSPRKRC